MTRTEFEELVRQNSRRLFVLAFRILRDKEEAEDTVQDVFIKIWNMREKTGEYRSLEALATTMTKNLCIDLLRKKKNMFTTDVSALGSTAVQGATPLEIVENSETGTILESIMRELPEPYRTVIKMRELDGEEYGEIAARTGQNINTVRVVLSRARKMIRDEYNRYQYEKRRIETADRKVL